LKKVSKGEQKRRGGDHWGARMETTLAGTELDYKGEGENKRLGGERETKPGVKDKKGGSKGLEKKKQRGGSE